MALKVTEEEAEQEVIDYHNTDENHVPQFLLGHHTLWHWRWNGKSRLNWNGDVLVSAPNPFRVDDLY